jgi:hypothetical protein
LGKEKESKEESKGEEEKELEDAPCAKGKEEQNDETLVLDVSLKRLKLSGTKQRQQSKLGTVRDTSSLTPLVKAQSAPGLQLVAVETVEDGDSGNETMEGDELDDETEDEDGKATKSDDAKVKVQKWNARLARKLGHQLTPEMEASMDVLRGFNLCRHKCRMTQSFLGWLHSQAKYKPCGIGMDLVVQLAQVVNPQVAGPEPIYSWAELGRAIYIDWWKDRFTTWWDWEDGSGPLHWRWPRWYLEGDIWK